MNNDQYQILTGTCPSTCPALEWGGTRYASCSRLMIGERQLTILKLKPLSKQGREITFLFSVRDSSCINEELRWVMEKQPPMVKFVGEAIK